MQPLRIPNQHRCGTAYLAVLGTSLIVSTLALTTLSLQRIQNRQLAGAADAQQAVFNAKTGLRLAMLQIEEDPDWRYRFHSGQWSEPVSTGDGQVLLQAVDPTDNNLLDDPTDPVSLVATGLQGDARQKVQVTLVPTNRGLDCLSVGVLAGRTLLLDRGSLQFFGTAASNDKIDATNNSDIWPRAEAVKSISGTGFRQETVVGVDPRQLPSPTDAFSFYLDAGTWIELDRLPFRTANLIVNSGAEVTAVGWEPTGQGDLNCQISQTMELSHQGDASFYITGRSTGQDGPCYDLTHALKRRRTYHLVAWVRSKAETVDFRLALNLQSDSGDQWLSGSWQTVDQQWTRIEAVLATPDWAGPLRRGRIRVESKTGEVPVDFYLDDASAVETGGRRRISRQVLSPAGNPFGQVNSNGIYVIDCNGADLLIEHSRIVGTLVLLNPGSNSEIGPGPINWQPALPHLPILLVSGELRIAHTEVGLSETENNVNFNGPGVPYEGLGTDSTLDDTYPSFLGGMLYASKTLIFQNQAVIRDGLVLSDDRIEIRGNLRLTQGAIYAQNPPPGFAGREEIRLLLNSFQKLPQ